MQVSKNPREPEKSYRLSLRVSSCYLSRRLNGFVGLPTLPRAPVPERTREKASIDFLSLCVFVCSCVRVFVCSCVRVFVCRYGRVT